MLEIKIIRHGQTPGNKLSRYIGVTDESLSQEGIEQLQSIYIEKGEALFVSPMKRCMETADILFRSQEQIIIPDLNECNFGSFENKNYLELSGNVEYQKWIDSNGLLPFPNGDSRESFQKRSLNGFRQVVNYCIKHTLSSVCIVTHGGAIMNILEAYAPERKDFYGWHVKNGNGYRILLEKKSWKNKQDKFIKVQDLLNKE